MLTQDTHNEKWCKAGVFSRGCSGGSEMNGRPKRRWDEEGGNTPGQEEVADAICRRL
jgi:hypothetical protein